MFVIYLTCSLLLVLHCPNFLYPTLIAARVQKERKKRWDEKNQEAIAEALKQLDDFDKVVINCLI